MILNNLIKNKELIKNVIIYGLITVIVIAAAIGIYNYTRSMKVAEGTISYNIYYVNRNDKQIDIEERIVNFVDDDKTMFNTVVDEFIKGPSSTNQKLVLPAEFKIKSKKFMNKIAYIDLESSFNDMSSSDKTMSIGALVYTLTDMSFIDAVNVTIGGKPFIKAEDGTAPVLLNRQNIRNNPVIDPEKTEWKTITLYFSDRSGNSLVSEQRSIEVKNSLTLEYQIVEQLIVGPDKTMLKATLSDDIEIRDIKTEQGICYVNLSDDFLKSNVQGINSEFIKIYSIVNSLTELSTVNKVQFLIEGEKINQTSNNIDFSKPFERNSDILKAMQ